MLSQCMQKTADGPSISQGGAAPIGIEVGREKLQVVRTKLIKRARLTLRNECPGPVAIQPELAPCICFGRTIMCSNVPTPTIVAGASS